MKKYIKLLIFLATILTSHNAMAQADTLLNFCASHLPSSYISDGQLYRTPLSKEETAEFNVTFYGETIYRVAACSGTTDGNLIFTIYDKSHNELFASADHKNTPYWDFKFNSTVDCIIEAQLDNLAPESGIAIILIGFKQ